MKTIRSSYPSEQSIDLLFGTHSTNDQ